MANEKSKSDAFRYYFTGASADGDAQPVEGLSLGKNRSSSEVQVLNHNRVSPIANIDINYVEGLNGAGNGTLQAMGNDELRWTPPGGAAGPTVTILNGETKVLEGGTIRSKYIRVSRTSATNLTGTETLQLSIKDNSFIDDLTDAERTSGDSHYRCHCVKNDSTSTSTNIKVMVPVLGTQALTDVGQLPASGAGTITTAGTFADWPEKGFGLIKDSLGAEQEVVYYKSRTNTVLTIDANGRGLALGDENAASAGSADDTIDAVPNLQIGIEAPSGSPITGTFTDKTGVGDESAPGGVSFSTPIVDADALSIGTLLTLEIYAVWTKRLTTVAAEAQAAVVGQWELFGDAA